MSQGLDIFRSLVLRWNRSISLVSRRGDAELRTDALIEECRDAWRAMAPEIRLRAVRGWSYFDLGTGGGFPGLVWAAEAAGETDLMESLGTWNLVEPREKRAWFLAASARAMGLEHVRVHCVRWGEGVPLEGGDLGWALVSMKALHLSDPEVLAGLRAAAPGHGGAGTITRFVTAGCAVSGVVDPRFEAPGRAGAPGSGMGLGSGRFYLALEDSSAPSSLLLCDYPASS